MAQGGTNSQRTIITRTQRCRKLLEDEEMADITFLVGVDKVPIKANKAMLRHGSNVFYKMFAYSEKEQNAYEVVEVNPEDFRVLLDYFYTGQIDMSFGNTVSMFKAATLYAAEEIIEECVQRISKSLNIYNCAKVLVLAIENENFELENSTIEFICRHADLIFKPTNVDYFDAFTEEALLKLIPLDKLFVNELKLFQTIVEWGLKKELLTHVAFDEEHSIIALRSILENLIQHVRFPLMKPSDFSTIVEPMSLLNKDEVNAVCLYFMVDLGQRDSYNAKIFKTKPRNYPLEITIPIQPKNTINRLLWQPESAQGDPCLSPPPDPVTWPKQPVNRSRRSHRNRRKKSQVGATEPWEHTNWWE